MTVIERHQLLAYRAERARRHWNDVTMWRWFAGAWIWLVLYLSALRIFGVI